MPGSGARRAISSSTPRRTSGSPPVMRSFSTPMAANVRASRSISSNVSSCSRRRNSNCLPKTSLGMQ
jgi:hypothetical protein